MTIHWTPSADPVTGYIVSYLVGSTPPADCSSGTTLPAGDGSSLNLSGLPAGSEVGVRVCCVYGSGKFSSGVTFVISTLALPPPDATSFVATASSSSRIHLSWTAAGGSTTGYKVAYASGASAPGDCSSSTDVGNVTSYNVTSLSASTQYSFLLCSYNGNPTPDISSGVVASATTSSAGTVTLTNMHDKQIVETGFVIGTSSGGVTAVGCQFDSDPVVTATGTATWKCAFPNGANTWHLGSTHTLTVGDYSSGSSLASTTTVTLHKGNNRDIDGDGYPDVVVGAFGTGSTKGAAYLYSGGSGGVSTTAAVTLTGPANGSFFGNEATMADVNGDGYADVIVAAYSASAGTGAVYIYNGKSPLSSVSTTATTTLNGAGNGYFGYSIAAGDINGDGYADVVVGAYSLNSGAGAVYIFNGASGSGSLSTTPVQTLNGSGTESLGSAVAVGDINDDGYADLIAGAMGSGAGAAYIFYGQSGSSGVSTPAATTLLGENSMDDFGGYAAAADVDGDGHAEVIIGANMNAGMTGAVYVYNYVSGSVSTTYTAKLAGPSGGERFGNVATGDINGDGYTDLVVGAYDYNGADGAVYVYNGSGSGVPTSPSTTVLAPVAGEELGSSVAASDTNGDGYADLITGAQSYSSNKGIAYIFNGASGGVSGTPTTTITTTPTGQFFGSAAH